MIKIYLETYAGYEFWEYVPEPEESIEYPIMVIKNGKELDPYADRETAKQAIDNTLRQLMPGVDW